MWFYLPFALYQVIVIGNNMAEIIGLRRSNPFTADLFNTRSRFHKPEYEYDLKSQYNDEESRSFGKFKMVFHQFCLFLLQLVFSTSNFWPWVSALIAAFYFWNMLFIVQLKIDWHKPFSFPRHFVVTNCVRLVVSAIFFVSWLYEFIPDFVRYEIYFKLF